ncbi:MalY/PatB family protein [Bifidobacterium avesanii]|uniref:cysteine-S-conjugate beta-lyase n=1 Tax=Bifidobacterium avesanii TaxID=1798157 RepID=A0A7K3TG68_9BIFI|nr:aminotransferase class I/II-fold pyridoxal phosphate-dependent enzyme [Bifidobacterium avesanii]KAB8294585.1 aspartate aminotransferase [Bifidobacterium avesanii]NEG78095.1 aminotransferase class I/II-fold pyridoxal phosphate-dependent enzyme [Bifidobacterium avesanii]
MAQYDFTSIIDRHGKDAIAIDAVGSTTRPGFAPSAPKPGFDVIPMWVADMNFPTAPSVREEIIHRMEHPMFGYFDPSDAYYRSIIDWHRDRNGVTGLAPEHIGYENGVLGGVVSALKAFAQPGDAVLLHSPTYNGFTHAIGQNGFRIEHSPLRRDADGVWRMDFDDMDRRLKENNIHVAVFCSPHNPTGRVWERWEIERAMEVYRANDCVVVSDEIWSDLILSGNRHIPTQSVSDDARERTIAFYAPSKTFSLAGLVGSYHIAYNKYLRDRLVSVSDKTIYNAMNVLSMHALIGAYKPEGREWLDQLLGVLTDNARLAVDYIRAHFPGVDTAMPQGTYMLFLDCTEWCAAHSVEIGELVRRGWDVGVAWEDGRLFEHPCAIRVNLALPKSRVEEALRRMTEYAFTEQ